MACGASPTAPVPEGEGIIILRDLNLLSYSQAVNRDVEDLHELDGPCEIDTSTITGGTSVHASWDDCISSVRVNPGWTATFYEDPGFRGRSFAIGVQSLGWMTGFEPATSGATVRRSTTELHPPSGGGTTAF